MSDSIVAPSVSVIYDGVDLSQWITFSDVQRNIGQTRTNNLIKIGRANGKTFGYITGEENSIKVTGDVNYGLPEKRRTLAAALTKSKPGKLVFGDEPDKYYMAIVADQPLLTEDQFHGEISITFIVPDGIAHSVATQTADDMPYKDMPVNLLTGTSNVQDCTMSGSHWIKGSQSKNGGNISIPGTPGASYTYSAIVKSATFGCFPELQFFDSNKKLISTVGNTAKTDTGLRYASGVAPAGTAFLLVHMVLNNPPDSQTVVFNSEKLAIDTTASPWSPNPADSEYYDKQIVVNNSGTYPTDPVIAARMHGDNGVVTVINGEGAVLQFGSPDETDGFTKQKSERVYHLDFNQAPTGVTLNQGKLAFPYDQHGNEANRQSGPFGYKDGIAYPSTERTAGNYWNGPSMSGTIPANSNGSKTANYQWVNRVNVGTNAPDVGRFEFNLTYQGKIVVSLALFDDSASNDQWVFSGTIYDGKDAKMLFFDLLPRNYYRDGDYNVVITKLGDQLTFRLDRLNLGDGGIETRSVSGFSKVPIDGWTTWFPGYSDLRGWSINWQDSYFDWINVDYWDDIPNRFKDGDLVEIDVANRRVSVNGAEDRTLQTIGNDWGGFKLKPGINTINLYASSWAKRYDCEVTWREAWM